MDKWGKVGSAGVQWVKGGSLCCIGLTACVGVCVCIRERERARERLLIFCRRELLLRSIFIVCCPTSFITPFYFFSKLCQAGGRFNSFLFLVFRFICGDACMDLTAKWAGHLVDRDTFSLQDHGESPLCSLFFFRVHAQFGYSPILQLSQWAKDLKQRQTDEYNL